MHKVTWNPQSELPHLEMKKIHLYKIDLTSLFSASDSKLKFHLTDKETERLNQYKFRKDQIRFGTGRSVLRLLLSHYANKPFGAIRFGESKYGKPFLINNNDYTFNLSHSGNLLLIGVGIGHQLGVDTELYNPNIDHLDLAKSVFSLAEQKELSELQGSSRVEGFYNCWSMKESFIKAVGLGLHVPLNQFSVRLLNHSHQSNLIDVSWRPMLLSELITRSCSIEPNYSAAYTHHKSIQELCFFELTDFISKRLKG